MDNESLEKYALLTEKQVAVFLNMSAGALRKRRALLQPPSFMKFGKSIRYDPEVIVKFKREATQ